MNIDAELMFECLMYLNTYYYPVLATCESMMTASKYISQNKDTPNIGQDAIVVFSRLTVEFIKIVLFKKFKDERRNIITAVAVFLTLITMLALTYTFCVQDPVLKLEYILGTMSTMLAITEVVFGTLQLLPCFQKIQYY